MKRLTVTLAGALLLLLAPSCRRGETDGPAADNQRAAANSTRRDPDRGDIAKLDAEINLLERQVERNPADEEVRGDLSDAYVHRGDAYRAAQQLKEALSDYRRALRVNPDNEEAMKNSAELSPLVEGTPLPGEYGEPAPPPISPNITGDEPATPSPDER